MGRLCPRPSFTRVPPCSSTALAPEDPVQEALALSAKAGKAVSDVHDGPGGAGVWLGEDDGLTELVAVTDRHVVRYAPVNAVLQDALDVLRPQAVCGGRVVDDQLHFVLGDGGGPEHLQRQGGVLDARD